MVSHLKIRPSKLGLWWIGKIQRKSLHGIVDDVTHLSLEVDPNFTIRGTYTSCLFWGLGSDGTVGANKNSVKIIGDNTDLYAQAYFQYDSRKAGGVTRSHLRFGPDPIQSTYYVNNADFISCSLDSYVTKYDILKDLAQDGTFLLNTTIDPDKIEEYLPNRMKVQLAKKMLNLYHQCNKDLCWNWYGKKN